MKFFLLTFTLVLFSNLIAQTPSLVDYNAFEKLVAEVKPHRAERLITADKFSELMEKEEVIILDTRSQAMYDAKHIKGAIHLDFSDFTQANLEALIPSKETKILIYCNNNFEDDQIFFATKAYVPPKIEDRSRELTLALNIPTYINLYGYGFRNIYELSELISIFDSRIPLEGSQVIQPITTE